MERVYSYNPGARTGLVGFGLVENMYADKYFLVKQSALKFKIIFKTPVRSASLHL